MEDVEIMHKGGVRDIPVYCLHYIQELEPLAFLNAFVGSYHLGLCTQKCKYDISGREREREREGEREKWQ